MNTYGVCECVCLSAVLRLTLVINSDFSFGVSKNITTHELFKRST